MNALCGANKLGASTNQPNITALLEQIDKQANTLLANLKNAHISLHGPMPEPTEAFPPPRQGSIALAQDIKQVLDMCVNLSADLQAEL